METQGKKNIEKKNEKKNNKKNNQGSKKVVAKKNETTEKVEKSEEVVETVVKPTIAVVDTPQAPVTKVVFASLVKSAYIDKGLKTNQEVFEFLMAEGHVPTDETEAAKFKRKVANAMWAIRTPEDAASTSRTSHGSIRNERLRFHLLDGKSNTDAWKAMYAECGEDGEFKGQFEAPSKKWIVDTAWAIRKKLVKEGLMDENKKLIPQGDQKEQAPKAEVVTAKDNKEKEVA